MIVGEFDLTGKNWTWDRSDVNGDPLTPGINHWSSDVTLNDQDDQDNYVDHMITYEITGSSISQKTWLLFWDDQSHSLAGGSDRDFNDFVVQISAHQVIPAPGAVLLGGIGIGFVRLAEKTQNIITNLGSLRYLLPKKPFKSRLRFFAPAQLA